MCMDVKTFKDTHRENTPSNKTMNSMKSIMKIVNMRIRVIGTSNQLFIIGFNFQNN